MSHDFGESLEHLLAKARAGDAESAGELLSGYRSYLRLIARLQIDPRVTDKVDASDIVQETFLHAHRGFQRFRGTTEAEFLAWLRRILASRLADQVRRYVQNQGRDVRVERSLEEELNRSSQATAALADPGSSPSERVARRERAVQVAEALESLPEHYRDVILLRHLKGLSFPEVAQLMDRSVDSVKHIWTRALAALQTALTETLHDVS